MLSQGEVREGFPFFLRGKPTGPNKNCCALRQVFCDTLFNIFGVCLFVKSAHTQRREKE